MAYTQQALPWVATVGVQFGSSSQGVRARHRARRVHRANDRQCFQQTAFSVAASMVAPVSPKPMDSLMSMAAPFSPSLWQTGPPIRALVVSYVEVAASMVAVGIVIVA